MLRSIRNGLAMALVFGLAGCFADTPSEPSQPRAEVLPSLSVASSAVGNITDLGTLGGRSAGAAGINIHGEIVGTILTTDFNAQGFLWRSGTVTHLGVASAADISDDGRIVGGRPAYVWQNGAVTELPNIAEAESCPTASSSASAVNAAGIVVGEGANRFCDSEPVLWENGVVRRLDPQEQEFTNGYATDINATGQVVGRNNVGAFLWENGTMRTIGPPDGNQFANGINDNGQVVGFSINREGSPRAFQWTNGVMTDLGTLGGRESQATDINNNGQVVGYSRTVLGWTRAFWWQNGVLSDLGSLGGDQASASAINESGQVVGASNTMPGGSMHAVRWTIPTTNFWSVRRISARKRGGGAVAVANGLLYAIGGYNNANSAQNAVEVYNPASNTWSFKAQLPAARQDLNGAATINGIIYVAGGRDAAGALTRTLYAYRISTNTWSPKANMPAVGGCGGSGVIAGKLYVFSGCSQLSTGASAVGQLYRYDPAVNMWSTLRPAPAVHVHPAVGAIGGKLYVAGGSDGAQAANVRLDVYDPATNKWISRAPMPTARAGMGSAVVSGKLYVMGGTPSAFGNSYLAANLVYDPVTDTWSRRAAMINPRAELSAGAVNQLIYAVGGRNNDNVLALNERYTP